METIDDVLVDALGWTAKTTGPRQRMYSFELANQAGTAMPMDFGPGSAERITRFADAFVRCVDFLGLGMVYGSVAESIATEELTEDEAWADVVIGWTLIMQEMRSLAVKERIATPDVTMLSWTHVWCLHLASIVVLGIYAEFIAAHRGMPFAEADAILADAEVIEELTNKPTEEFEDQFGNLFLLLRECA